MNNSNRVQEKSLFSWVFTSSLIFVIAPILPTVAQLTPDNTLGSEASSVTPNVVINGGVADQVGGGARREGNLFHSFSDFNIDDGQRVYFANPSGVLNILTRVTGGNRSNILGTLGVDGNANLFLMNPNGILFGRNASLDLQGSFVGTTANGVQFGTQGFFNATNPQEVPLLTVNPSALFYNQLNGNAGIQNNSKIPAGIEPLSGFQAFGLRVPDGKSLLLVGGNISMDGGELNAFGGNVELGGLAAPGNINLVVDGDNLRLGFPEDGIRADVSLTNQARVEVTGVGGGNLLINAGNIDILNGSILDAGIFLGTGTPETVAGDIRLNATGEITVADRSLIRNFVRQNSQGQGGNITIGAGSFQLRDGSGIIASTYGEGNAGNVTINAKDSISLASNSTIYSTVEAGGVGKGGNIDINAVSLYLTDVSLIATTMGKASGTQAAARGNAGNIDVKVSGIIDIAGEKNGIPSAIRSDTETGTFGNSGNITIDSGSFSLRDGAIVSAATTGQGNGGNVIVSAKETVSLKYAAILSTIEAGAVGQGGNIDLNATSLSLIDAGQLVTIVRDASDTQPAGRGNAGNINVKVAGAVDIIGAKNGFGSVISSRTLPGTVANAGNITIDASSFSLRDSARIQSSTFGQGSAGNVTLRVKDAVSLADNAVIFSAIESGGVGKGGNININSSSLSLKDVAQLTTITRGASNDQPPGKGDAGNVNIKVSGIVDIAGVKNGFPSGIFSLVDTGTEGDGGDIIIDAGSFQLRDGALLESSTFGQGNAGKINVNAAEFLTISGSNSGLNSGLYVNSGSNTGAAGDIIVTSPKVILDNRGTLNSESASGNGGNINLTSNLLLLRRGGQITTNAGTAQQGGDGGNINLNSRFIVAIPNENSDITANAFTGKGGNINIQSRGIFGIEPRDQASDKTNDITASSQLGLSGNVNVNSPDNSSIQNSLSELSNNFIDTNALIANSCIARANKKQENSFSITGTGALPNRPGEIYMSNYSTDKVREIPNENPSRSWKKGDAIVEPTGVYLLSDGRLIMSREWGASQFCKNKRTKFIRDIFSRINWRLNLVVPPRIVQSQN